jgi:hypothetical protein
MRQFRELGFLTILAVLGFSLPVHAGGTNCWGSPLVRHKLDRTLVSSDRCDKPSFYLTEGEANRNIRSSPSGKVIGKMNEVGSYSTFESSLIATYDDGKTYWAFGEAFSESNPGKRIKGWVEVGDETAIKQYHRPGSNDIWYRF